jgi:hypothetical protein
MTVAQCNVKKQSWVEVLEMDIGILTPVLGQISFAKVGKSIKLFGFQFPFFYL